MDKLREKFFLWLIKLFKVPKGQQLPKALVVVRCILFPILHFRLKMSMFKYDPRTHTVSIFGVRFTVQALWLLAKEAEDGAILRLYKSHGNAVTLELIDESKEEYK